MKNVTVTMEDAVADWARLEAAKRNTSVSRMVGELLSEKMRHDDAYARAMREWQSDTTTFSSGLTGDQKYPPRADTYAE